MMIHIRSRLSAARLKRQAAVFALLGSPARMAIVAALGEGERDVGELVAILGGLDCGCSAERTNVSKHLALLREAGIVSATGEGHRRIYRLETPCLLEAIDCVLDKDCAAARGRNHDRN